MEKEGLVAGLVVFIEKRKFIDVITRNGYIVKGQDINSSPLSIVYAARRKEKTNN